MGYSRPYRVFVNLCYDVPVKLYSSHLWLMSLSIAWPSLRRLFDALILDRPVAPGPRRGIWMYWANGLAEPYKSAAPTSGPMTLDLSAWSDATSARVAPAQPRLPLAQRDSVQPLIGARLLTARRCPD
jgi:hypothetical protein